MPLRAGTATPTFRLGTASVSRMYLGSVLAYSQSGAGGGGGGGGGGEVTLPVPTNLVVVAGDASAVLAWRCATGPTGFLVQYSTNGGALWQDVPAGYTYSQSVAAGVISSTATIGSLSNGSTYIFRVASTTSSAAGAWSVSSGRAILNSAPTTPSSVSASTSGRTVVVSWGASSGTADLRYTVFRSSNGTDYIPAYSNINALSLTLTPGPDGLVPGTSYTFKVQAKSVGTATQSGDSEHLPVSAMSSATSGVTAPAQLASAPEWLDVEPSAGAVLLRFLPPAWDGGAAVTSYNVYVHPFNTAKPSTPTTTVLASAPTLYNTWRRVTVSGLTNATTYRCSVVAVTSEGEGAEKWNAGTPLTSILPIQSLSVTALTAGSKFSYAGGVTYDYPATKRAVSITWSTAPYPVGQQRRIAIEYRRASLPESVSCRNDGNATDENGNPVPTCRLYDNWTTLIYANQPSRQYNSGGNTIDTLDPNTAYVIRVRDMESISPYAYWVITTAA